MTNNKGISVLIPNYNGAILLPQILPPLFIALQNSLLPYEIIVSDDCSTDDTITFLKTNYPQIILIENKTNEGFSKTINKGIFVAKNDYLLLLNSDVILSENYFDTLIPYFDMPDTFGVMGRIIGWDNDAIQDGGKYPSYHGVKIKTSGNYIPLEPKADDKLYSMYLSGANALVSKEKILALNGFDEIFSPFYIEDFELSLRAWRLGWKCYYDHTAVCRHQTSTTIKSKSNKVFVKTIYNRNKMILHSIHLSKNKLWLWYLQLPIEVVLNFFTARFWYFKSLKLFFSVQKEIKLSKNNFIFLQKKYKNEISLNEIVKTIIKKLEFYKIDKF